MIKTSLAWVEKAAEEEEDYCFTVGRMGLLPLPINCSYWRDFSEEQLEFFADEIFTHYRVAGFPYHCKSLREQKQALRDMGDFFAKNCLIQKDGIIQQTMHCLSTAWTYFPHAWEIRCGKMRTPMEVFNDAASFKKLIRKQLRMATFIGNTRIRSRLNNFTGTQNVSNFRPSAARAIYDEFLETKGRVWDMSCGFGGRLLGALSSPVVGTYIGTEPSLKTYSGLVEMNKNLNVVEPSCYENWWDDEEDLEPKPIKEVVLHNMGSEDFLPEKESLDLCFTSPPYFDTEKYDTAPTQSYLRFPTKELWLNGFLMKTIENCYYGLKPNSHLIINIANVKTYKTVENDLLEKMKDLPFKHVKTLQLQLATMGSFKYEPVFVYKKMG